MKEKVSIYVNFSNDDIVDFDLFAKHIYPLLNKINLVTHNSISLGSVVTDELQIQLKEEIDIVIHLITKNYISDSRCLFVRDISKVEEKIKEIPILLSSCIYDHLEFEEVFLPRTQKPVLESVNIDEVYTNITIELAKFVDGIINKPNQGDENISINNFLKSVLEQLENKSNQESIKIKAKRLVSIIQEIINLSIIDNETTSRTLERWYLNKSLVVRFLDILEVTSTLPNKREFENDFFLFYQQYKHRNLLVNRYFEKDKTLSLARKDLLKVIPKTDFKLEYIQSNLGKKDLIINYISLLDKYIAFAISNESYKIIELPKSPVLKEIIDWIDKNTKANNHEEIENQDIMVNNLNLLYIQLLHPILNCFDGIDKLYLLPDEELMMFPFDTLIRKKGKDLIDSEYLVNIFMVSYHFSYDSIIKSFKNSS